MKRVVVMSNEALYFWLVGASLMLTAIFAGLDNPEGAAHLAAAGGGLMVIGFGIPPLHGLVRNLMEFRRHRAAESNGGESR